MGSPLATEVPDVELGGAALEAVVEEEETSRVAPALMSANSPSPISEIFLTNPPVVDASLASIDQAALSLMVISRGGLEGQVTPTLYGKEVVSTSEGATCEPSIFKSIGEKFMTPAETVSAPED